LTPAHLDEQMRDRSLKFLLKGMQTIPIVCP
jgi:hypothetical protein